VILVDRKAESAAWPRFLYSSMFAGVGQNVLPKVNWMRSS
jgi:hypothetical protein